MVRRHPAATACDEFRSGNRRLFDDAATGRYLKNRLEVAFQSGWDAAVRAVYQALEGKS